MNSEQKEIPKPIDHKTVMRGLAWLGGIAAAFLLTVYATYALNFSSLGISPKQEAWGQFGDFIGGTVNPVLSFLTLAALIITIVLQSQQLAISSRELQLSREEIQMTREELQRSADAQELSERALKKQATAMSQSARLSAINYLLESYESELKRHAGNVYKPGEPRSQEKRILEEKQKQLKKMLEDIFNEVTKKEDSARIDS